MPRVPAFLVKARCYFTSHELDDEASEKDRRDWLYRRRSLGTAAPEPASRR